MFHKDERSVTGIFFQFLLFLGIFLSAYFFFVIMGSALGVFIYQPEESVLGNYQPDENYPVFVIDPGHGGMDGGAIADDGTCEKDLNLSFSLRLGEYLESAGAKVVFTRTEDIMLEYPGAPTKKSGDVMRRVLIAKEHPEAVFVSIHMNKFPQTQYRGLQVFYSDNHKESEKIAGKIQENVIHYLQQENQREAKSVGNEIFVLDRLQSPAVLIECGFLSNPDELKLLQNDVYLSRLAFIVAHSLLSQRCEAE